MQGGRENRSEQDYDRERSDELVWNLSKNLGLPRREVVRLLGIATGAVQFPRRTRAVVSLPDEEIVKPAPAKYFTRSGANLEMRWEAMSGRGYIVPNELFFVRNNSASVPRLNLATWKLDLFGSGLSNPMSISYDDLIKMPSVSVVRAIECAGNGRNMFRTSHGHQPPGLPWDLGAVGVAKWTGVPLRDVLDRAGLKKSARDAMPEGLDDKRIKRPMPIDKALDDAILVYAMNGVPLPRDHGFPVRVLVPGWVGIAHIKWVGRIEVSESSLYSEYNTSKYVLHGEGYEPEPPALGPMLTTQKVKSAFELPWDGEVSAGPQILRGRSWSGEGSIDGVEVSTDGGQTWQPAHLHGENIEMAWARWEVGWNPRPGRHLLKARATDSKGNTQPDSMPLNTEGYDHWAVVCHPVMAR